MIDPLFGIDPTWPTLLLCCMLAWRLRPLTSPRSIPPHGERSTDDTGVNNQGVHRRRRIWPLLNRRRARPSAAEAAAWCDAIGRELRAGATLAAAVTTSQVSPAVEPYVAAMRRRLRRGSSLAAALRDEVWPEPLRIIRTVLVVLANQGGDAGQPIDRTAAVLRSRAATDAERETQSAQARLSARVMTVLPVVMLAVLLATSAAVRSVTFGPLGAVVVGAGATLNFIGWRWMRHIIDRGSHQ